jgi:hypothetical protein
MDRSRLATVKGAAPEAFVLITVNNGLDIKRMHFFDSEHEVRKAYRADGRTDGEIDSIIRTARQHQV